MKLFLAPIAFLSFLLSPVTFGASYPTSCPTEAQAIVDAVGGCQAISCNQYEAICAKCCVKSEPILEPLPQSDSETSSDSFAILVIILILGGLAYLMIWFVRKRKKGENLAPNMLEKKCPYCKGVIPGDATRCSHCQADLRSWPRRHPILTAIILLSLLFIIIGLA